MSDVKQPVPPKPAPKPEPEKDDRLSELEGRVSLLEKYLRAVNLLPPADHVEPEPEKGEKP